MRNNVNVPIEVNSFNMLRNADVDLEVRKVVPHGKKEPVTTAVITVDGKYHHEFSPKSRISKALDYTQPEILRDRLNKGNFFFVNDKLVDFRDNQYMGYVHDDQSIGKMIDLIGVRTVAPRERRTLGIRTQTSNLALAGHYASHEIVVPEFYTGGIYEARLMFLWNPFYTEIRGVFELWRQICTNGMIGVADVLNTRFPVVNMWEENMDIAARQITNRIDERIQTRLRSMDKEVATVGELQILSEHALKRLTQGDCFDQEQETRLRNIYKAVTPSFHLSHLYKTNVFDDSNVAAQMPGHLSVLTAFNAATEVYSHTDEVADSTGFALQRFANNLLFNVKNKREQLLNRLQTSPLSSPFNDPATAFIGVMQ